MKFQIRQTLYVYRGVCAEADEIYLQSPIAIYGSGMDGLDDFVDIMIELTMAQSDNDFTVVSFDLPPGQHLCASPINSGWRCYPLDEIVRHELWQRYEGRLQEAARRRR